MPLLSIENLHVSVGGHPILKGVDLVVNSGEVHVIVGPNGSGKSTLAQTIMGLPQFTLTEGSIALQGADVATLSLSERARSGIFMAYQHPVAIPGLPLFNVAYGAYQSKLKGKSQKGKMTESPSASRGDSTEPGSGQALSAADFFAQKLLKPLTWLKLPEEMIQRAVNDDLSGGEKKKTEILQLLVANPKLAILDEIDSGLDRDAVKVVFEAVAKWRASFDTSDSQKLVATQDDGSTGSPQAPALIVISHHPSIAELITPDYVHVMMEGNIIATGGVELLDNLADGGFEHIV